MITLEFLFVFTNKKYFYNDVAIPHRAIGDPSILTYSSRALESRGS